MTNQKLGLGFVGLSARRGWAALAHLPALLGITIFNEKTSSDAFDRLWLLAQHESAYAADPLLAYGIG